MSTPYEKCVTVGDDNDGYLEATAWFTMLGCLLVLLLRGHSRCGLGPLQNTETKLQRHIRWRQGPAGPAPMHPGSVQVGRLKACDGCDDSHCVGVLRSADLRVLLNLRQQSGWQNVQFSTQNMQLLIFIASTLAGCRKQHTLPVGCGRHIP